MQKLKKGSVVFLFIVGIFMMLGHSIIPHHHHTNSNSISLHKENDCTTSKDEHNEEHDAPYHCHAFNDTDWFKQESVQENTKIVLQYLTVFSNQTDQIQVLNRKRIFVNRNVLTKDLHIQKFSAPRAPPLSFS